MSDSAVSILHELKALGDPAVAKASQSFFKTGKGQYGEGDRFLGIRVPVQRKVARDHQRTPIAEIEKLLHSEWHEARLTALLIAVRAFEKGDAAKRAALFDLYLANTARINNWDLVDLSAPNIVGAHLRPGKRALLTRLAKSPSLWERRIAVLATFAFIRQGYFDETLRISELLLHDPHDLIHKGVGWALREGGKKDRAREEEFLIKHAAVMPRTMLRYAIEKFEPEVRKMYMLR